MASSEAVRIGYSEMWLDTLPSMREALSLYEKVGFTPIEPHYETPVAGTVFLTQPYQGQEVGT
jgi:ribosomal protein S18 acetylase RimI-like enzyme